MKIYRLDEKKDERSNNFPEYSNKKMFNHETSIAIRVKSFEIVTRMRSKEKRGISIYIYGAIDFSTTKKKKKKYIIHKYSSIIFFNRSKIY